MKSFHCFMREKYYQYTTVSVYANNEVNGNIYNIHKIPQNEDF